MSGRNHVVVVGAGPGGLAAAHQLVEFGAAAVDVTLFNRTPSADHLGGTIPVALGEHPVERFRARLAVPGVDCRVRDVTEVLGTGVRCGTEWTAADAVIAAPGLCLDREAVPPWDRASVLWDLDSAAAAAPALEAVPGGLVVVAIPGGPYRCPPAPFGLAMALAHHYRASGRFNRVCVTTPEPYPLAGVGGDAPAFLLESCSGAGVELERDFRIDLRSSEDGVLRSVDGRELTYERALIVPPHVRSPLLPLALAPGDGPLVEVDPRGETAVPGLYLVGDAAATGMPRAAGVAAAAGRTAADAVLHQLGVAPARDVHRPEPACYLRHAGNTVSRIRIRYPGDGPQRDRSIVMIDGPSPDLALAAEGERVRFLASAGGGSEGDR